MVSLPIRDVILEDDPDPLPPMAVVSVVTTVDVASEGDEVSVMMEVLVSVIVASTLVANSDIEEIATVEDADSKAEEADESIVAEDATSEAEEDGMDIRIVVVEADAVNVVAFQLNEDVN